VTSNEIIVNLGAYQFFLAYLYTVGHAVTQWLRHCDTNRKVADSIVDGVTGFFSFTYYGLGFDRASNRNEYQKHFLGVKVAGA
jgi:hypothetical protein